MPNAEMRSGSPARPRMELARLAASITAMSVKIIVRLGNRHAIVKSGIPRSTAQAMIQ